MKKLVSILTIMILMFLLVFDSFQVEAASKSYKVTTVVKATVYNKANTKSKKVAILKKGEKLTVTPYSKNWVKIKYKKKTCYIQKKNIKKVTTVFGGSKPYAAQLVGKVTVYNKANTKSKKVATFKKGKKLTVTPYSKNWVKIKYKKKTCYIQKKGVKKVTTVSWDKKQYTAKVVVKTLVYDKANIGAKKLYSLKKDSIIQVIGTSKSWIKIYNGDRTIGYIPKKNIKKGKYIVDYHYIIAHDGCGENKGKTKKYKNLEALEKDNLHGHAHGTTYKFSY